MADASPDHPLSLDEINDLDSYMQKYGSSLAKKIQTDFRPLHVPGVDPIDPLIATLRKELYPAQSHFVTATVKCLGTQKGFFGVGACGTGKTPMSAAIVHCLSKGNPYRAIVMVPDHLIKRWDRHLKAWLPECRVTMFDSWKDWVKLANEWTSYPKHKRPRPTTAEWFIIGRDASKFDPSWVPKFMPRTRSIEGAVGKSIQKVMHCPTCGAMIVDARGVPWPITKLVNTKQTCRAAKFTWDASSKELVESGVCGAPLWGFIGTANPSHKDEYKQAVAAHNTIEELSAKKLSATFTLNDRDNAIAKVYREFLKHPRSGLVTEGFQYGKSLPWRWAPARTIHKRLKGFFDYAILDEAHELKGEAPAQANAGGKLIAASRKSIALTGTILGGYAWHVFPITYRLCPRTLKEEGIEWGQEMLFSERYGRVDEIVITRNKQTDKVANSGSMGAKENVVRRKAARPGIMPTLFGRHMISNTVFLGLEEVSEALPPRPIDELREIAMDADIADTYQFVENRIKETIAPMLAMGDTSLLARMLQTLLAFSDHPWGWTESRYLEPFGIYKLPEFDPDRIYPKERDLIDYCLAERDDGRKVWVYAQMTNKRDVLARLVKLMSKAGLRAAEMRASVDRREREDWIIRNAPGLDVMISHPKLVETGIDLFYFDEETGDGHNFPSIYWYQTGYNLFTLRQASRRAWRIGQPEACRCSYAFYRETMQERAMALIGKKLAAAEAIDGKFSSEGLAALAGDDSLELQLARSLAARIDGAARHWSRLTTAGTWTPRLRVKGLVAPNGQGPLTVPLDKDLRQIPARSEMVDGQLQFQW